MTDMNLDPLRANFDGALVTAADGGWDQARQAWNLAVDQRPAAVAQATSADDVAAAIRFARERGLRLAPQSSGHGAAPLAPLDGTLLLRTGPMAGIQIDADARMARVEAGALWGEVAVAAGEHGLAALQGSSIDVGVVGYTLGGGLGWLARRYGLASNSVRAIELVTADGELRRVDHEHEPELFWALRGGGGSFGAVTAMELDLFPLAEVYAATLFWPAEAQSELLHAYREWARGVPDEATSIFRFLHLPPLPEVPEPLRDTPVVDVGVAFIGDEAAGDELIAPLRAVAPRLMETAGMVPAADLGRLHGDPEEPAPGIGDQVLLSELTPEAADALVGVAGDGSGSPLVGIELRHVGGAVGRREPGQGALDALDAEYVLYGFGVPFTPELGQAVRERLALVGETMAPWATGRRYLNFADQAGEDGAFAADVYARLREIKASVDPDNLFMANHPLA